MRSGSWRFWPRRFRYPSRIARQSAGYNLVVLAIGVTVLNILVAKSLPQWSTAIQREKEEELIFRGLQYAEALRLFEIHNGRPPNKLEELMPEGQRRYIRQLWANPMAEDGSWGLIFQDTPTAQQRGNGRDGAQRGRPRPERGRGRQNQNNTFGLPRDGQQVRIGPIIGVYSRVGGDAVKVFAPLGGGGGEDYSQWRFTKDLLQGLGNRGVGATDGQVQVPTMNAGNIGRPWPQGISLPRFQGGRRGVPNNRQGRGNDPSGGGSRPQANGQNR